MASMGELRTRAAAFLERPDMPAVGVMAPAAAVEEPPPFSLFVPAQLKEALDLAAHLMELANASEGEGGLEQVLEAVETAARQRNLELVKYALMVFVNTPSTRPAPADPGTRAALTDVGAALACRRPGRPVRGQGGVRGRGGARLVPRGHLGQRPPLQVAHRVPRRGTSRPAEPAAADPAKPLIQRSPCGMDENQIDASRPDKGWSCARSGTAYSAAALMFRATSQARASRADQDGTRQATGRQPDVASTRSASPRAARHWPARTASGGGSRARCSAFRRCRAGYPARTCG
jgi:hypothetical protein